ncbi:SDR family oxidoreductase [Granulicella sp. S190]|uniref:SDR family NAD(P)-dependent oxidoreductase n=1 Tax=Granulicella sp. S190 TaxID=1747226 RepID=UPI00131CC81D|nr:SDR family NAD(P)-dependent oxidoreductase [Granulicella sp. S190]
MSESNSSSIGAAIVTGASSGIGKVYVDRLAARGYNLILIARRTDRLQQIAADLKERFSIRAEVLVADFSQPAGLSETIEKIASNELISVLVNNAGYSLAKPLTEIAPEVMANMIALNVTALSKAALERFTLRGNGTIINIGSGAGIAPITWIPVYGPTKSYVLQFTQILQQQVAGTNAGNLCGCLQRTSVRTENRLIDPPSCGIVQ